MRHASPLVSSLLLLAACGPSASSVPGGDGGGGSTDASVADAAAPDAALADASPKADADPGTPDAGAASGALAYYFGDFGVVGEHRVARVDLGNGASTLLDLQGFEGHADISGVAVSPDGTKIAVAGQDTVSDAPALHVYAADGSGAPVVLYTGPASTSSIRDPAFSPDGSWVAFRADSELAGSLALHVAPVDASAAARRVSLMPVAANQDVSSFRWAGDSNHIAFTGDLVTNNVVALWAVNATAVSPSTVEIVTTQELGDRDVGDNLAFDSSDRLYFRADFELADNQFRLYRASVDGTGRVQVPGTALTNAGGTAEAAIGTFGMSKDGNTLAFSSDSPTADLYQLYVLDVATAAPTLVSEVTTTAPASGLAGPNFFEDIEWSPDGSALVFSADWAVSAGDQDNDFAAFVVPTSGVPGGTRLLGPQVASGDVFTPVFGADSATVVFRGDITVSNRIDLFATSDLSSADQDPGSIALQESAAGGNVDGFVVAGVLAN
jgi:Tol biopolymer transport system component